MAASVQRPPSPPTEEFDKDTVALHLRGLAHQATLFRTQSLNQTTLDQILAAVQATNTRMDAVETRMGEMETRLKERMDGIKTHTDERITTLETGMNKRFDKIDSFAQNSKARAKNARSREVGVPYTPLVKEDGSAIRNFPLTFDEVNTLAEPRLSTLLRAVGVELEDDWTVEQKRNAFFSAIGVMNLPTFH
ncbi:uncharacterized protein FFUJ_14251 [Fusarium fujikuroi IMI 58289]|uniref:Uncharacterized protein n=1 Tax=Gibberella fujikuroi (strain CBS 195.34 / IMI 58289 / NRRL A-6831) TaxID=1279085 RepID=S0EM55_GIBF5|nr:uncharacterized protein FFUJ_14251 [Fusarium fujikuroi IMI 58289]KLP07506.1 uncharacterized protein LW94_3230 [Fusarium fujikuroi]QGI71310.1 hypothetical protein CEK27_003639 [Fusarium fujikuroi]QGI88645.1 hypothetical protein CEK25_003601 [Fusarium fujikuroi]QGJ02203.1 hypothetical protein CEK26_003647 [Fusarium fujikuroi]CCT76118.1 uncharacterized protein FFUJ_14251 [Fusarium fujikuroi IMI 58289]